MAREILTSHYFRRMLALLLAATMLPMLALGVTFISLYAQALDRMTLESAQAQAAQTQTEIDGFVSQCAQLSQTCAGQLTVKSVLSYLPGKVELSTLAQVLELLTTDRKDQVALHVVGASRSFSSSELPERYQYDNFSSTALFAMLDSMPRASVFFAQPYTDGQGRRIALSVVTPVSDYYNRFVGYAIVDIYETAFKNIAARFAGTLDMALWYEDTLLTSSGDIPTGAEVRAMSGYAATDTTGGLVRGDNRCYFWNQGAYNRLSRVFVCDTAPLRTAKQAAVSLLAVLIVFTALLAVALAVWMSIRQSKPILQLYQAMDEVGRGNLRTQAKVVGKDELADLTRRFNLLVRQLEHELQENEQRAHELRKQEIMALQAQINPHFLYNSLSATRSLIRMERTEEAGQMIVYLSALLHANLQAVDKKITLNEDIELIEKYIAIQNLRFQNRFTLLLDIPQEMGHCLLPSLILQPIVENAVEHGLERKEGNGTLSVSARREGDDVVLTVTDDGVGIAPEVEQALNAARADGSHIGYLNVRRRIELYYGQGYGAQIHALAQGTQVTLRIRWQTEEQPCTSS